VVDCEERIVHCADVGQQGDSDMSYVVFKTDDTRLVRRSNGAETFKTEAAAKAFVTRYLDASRYTVSRSEDYYGKIEATVERVNLMSGQTYRESINTPGYMSPASESYWSM
jgi:hypothetical protein